MRRREWEGDLYTGHQHVRTFVGLCFCAITNLAHCFTKYPYFSHARGARARGLGEGWVGARQAVEGWRKLGVVDCNLFVSKPHCPISNLTVKLTAIVSLSD